MKRFITLFAAAAVAVLSVSSCYTESTEALYDLYFTIGDESQSFGLGADEAEKALSEIESSVNTFTKASTVEWKETVKNNDFSSADASARARYQSVLTEFQKLEADVKAKAAAITPGLKASFSYTYIIKLKRWAPNGNDAELEQYSFTVSYQE